LAVESRGKASAPERAVLVGVDFAVRKAGNRVGQSAARRAAVSLDANPEADDSLTSESPLLVASPSPGLDADESLAEFRELVNSAGGLIAAELMQRRARPDPATLIGSGKVEEIPGLPLRSRQISFSSITIFRPPSCVIWRRLCPAAFLTGRN